MTDGERKRTFTLTAYRVTGDKEVNDSRRK